MTTYSVGAKYLITNHNSSDGLTFDSKFSRNTGAHLEAHFCYTILLGNGFFFCLSKSSKGV